jgi:hypothetical protein
MAGIMDIIVAGYPIAGLEVFTDDQPSGSPDAANMNQNTASWRYLAHHTSWGLGKL